MAKMTTTKISSIGVLACLACFAGPILAVLATATVGTLLGMGLLVTALATVGVTATLIYRQKRTAVDPA